MTNTKRCVALIGALLLGAACDDPITDPAPPSTPQLLQVGVSEPVTPAAAAGAKAIAGGGSAGLAYVAFAEGELGDAVSVRVGNAATGVIPQTLYPVTAGALDPVAVAASVGDTLQLEATYPNASVAFLRMLVPERRPPRIIRTSPTEGRTDVALNSVVVVVFSEPIDTRTITTETVQLSCGGAAIAGAFEFSSPPATAVQFDPDGELPGGEACRLAIGAGVRDLGGDPLDGSHDVEFHTAGTTKPIPLPPGSQTGQIAFVRDGRIYVANPDSSGVTPLTEGPYDSSPAWSPDGQRLAFIRMIDGRSSIYLMNADGSNLRQRTGANAMWPGTRDAPSWSPDGHWIAFVCRADNGNGDICTMKVDDAGVAPINISHHGGDVSAPSWSPDGTRIAFGSDWWAYDFLSHIWVVGADGSQPTNFSSSSLSPGPWVRHHQPAWSPDGRRIAIVDCPSWLWRNCSEASIALINVDGSGVIPLLAASGFQDREDGGDHGEYIRPQWSPDGQVIAFGSSEGIEWVSADGRVRGLIIRDAHSPAWRP